MTEAGFPGRTAAATSEGSAGKTAWIWAVVLLAVAGLDAAVPLWSNDLFWHLAIGRATLAEGRLLSADPLTHTAAAQPWVQHEWLGQVTLAAAESGLGLAGLRAVRAVLVLTVLLLLLLAFRRRLGRLDAAVAFTAVAWLFLEPNTGLRPHLFGWIAAALLFGLVWPAADARGKTAAGATAAITVVWVNLHSSALLAPLIAGAWTVGLLLSPARDPGAIRRGLARIAVSFAAVLLSPAGFHLLSYALATPAANVASEEWQALLSASTWSFRPALLVAAVALLLAVLALGIGRGARSDSAFPGPWAALAVLALAFDHRRMVAFAFVPLLFVARRLREDGRLEGLRRLWPTPARRWTVAALLALTSVLLLARAAVDAAAPETLRRNLYPEAAADFLADARLEGKLFNGEAWGGYLAWRLAPRNRTFLDGRWLLAGEAVVEDHARLYLHRDASRLADRYGIEILIQRTGDYIALPALPPGEWSLAWIDPVAVVLLRRGEHSSRNRERVCAFRVRHPELADHADWPAELREALPVASRPPAVSCGASDAAPGGESG